PVVVADDAEAARDFLKPMLALYVGGMGARGANFYNRLACRYGYEAEAQTIQELYLGGRKNDAAAAVPDPLVKQSAPIPNTPRRRARERRDHSPRAGSSAAVTGAPRRARALTGVSQRSRDAGDRAEQRQPSSLVAGTERCDQLDLDRVHRVDVRIAQVDRPLH